MKKEKKQKKMRRPSRIAFFFVSLLLVIVTAVNVVLATFVKPYYGFAQTFLSSAPTGKTVDKARETSAEATKRAEEEGLVMLKNNGALPLQGKKVNVFGSGSINWTYGGTGSGSGDTSRNIDLYKGLANAGFTVNPDLKKFTKKNTESRESKGLVGTDFTFHEIAADKYSDELMSEAKTFSDTALVVFSRTGGESTDCPTDATVCGGDEGKHYLELQSFELDLLKKVEDNFDKVVVILNSPNAMELGQLADEKVDGVLWVGCTGSTGCDAIGEILDGEINPSGRTTDIFAYDLTTAPSYYCIGDHTYTNASYENTSSFAGSSEVAAGTNPYAYVEYIEGIYVGYRYYETAAADGFIDYSKTVQFPFGYGLSYTSFEKKITSMKDDGKTITLQVKDTNTGKVAGKDVAEIYYSAPYTKGGIEKSSVVLADFEKTKELQPGQSQTLTFTIDHEDMASYDYTGVKAEGGAWVLEKGDYQISVRSDSHTLDDQKTVKIDRDYIYNEDHDGKRESDGVAATNQFDDNSFGNDLQYVSRADWKGTFPKEVEPAKTEASDEVVAALKAGTQTQTDKNTKDIVTKNNGLALADLKGVDYDDGKWDQLMEQVSVKEMKNLIGNGGWMTLPVKSVKKPYLRDCDGPAGVNNMMANKLQGINGNQFEGASVLGQTWNREIASAQGEAMGAEFKVLGMNGCYGPAMNIHRSPFAGRNFEYFSEDGTLSGMMAAEEIRGIRSTGTYVYPKHFVLNDQETHRADGGLITWANEQSMREIYFKAFEIPVKDKDAQMTGMMSSYNRLGTTPTAESRPLLTQVLRNEWGFKGCVITDCVMGCSTEEVNKALLAGNDLQLNFLQQGLIKADTPAQRQALRQATRNILYMIVNSDAMENADKGMSKIEMVVILVGVILYALFFAYYFRRHKKMKVWKEWKAAQDGAQKN